MNQPMIQMYTNFKVAQFSARTEGFHYFDFTSGTKNHKFITCWRNVNDVHCKDENAWMTRL